MIEGEWVDDPSKVKDEFRDYFASRFCDLGICHGIDFAKAYDSIRWDYLGDVLKSFGFGVKWCSWIRGILNSSMASILVNGSPTKEFQFHRGLKQGDPLASYLFIIIMKSLHLSFSRVIEAGIFTGENMSSIWAWDETVNKLKLRLSSWKLKTLSIGGRLTLLKSVLRSTPIYNMSLFKVPKAVLKSMESIRRNFFNGIRDGEKKIAWVLVLSNTGDRRFWDLNGDGCFRVKDVRKMLDDMLLPKSDVPSRWVKQIPIKVNVLTWKISMDRLPTRVNLHWRGVQFVSVFFAGRNSKVAVRTGINNKMSGQITVKTSSSKYLALALTAVIPWLISGCKKLWPGDMEKYTAY
nr:RNA-directed DNA polymerase, eukaryota, reverse transcriptase zinc-binding domain protein [Tanacetum cinerariifolium]